MEAEKKNKQTKQKTHLFLRALYQQNLCLVQKGDIYKIQLY